MTQISAVLTKGYFGTGLAMQMKFSVIAGLPPHPRRARVWSRSPRVAPRVVVGHCAVCAHAFPVFELKMPAKCCAGCDAEVRRKMNRMVSNRERQRRHRGVQS